MWFVCLIIYNLELNKYLIGPFTTLIFKKLSRWFYPLLFIAKIDKKRRGVTSVLTLGIGREREQWHSLKQNKKQKTVSGNPQENPRIYICQHKRSCMRHSHQKFQRWTSQHPPCLQTLQQPLGSCTCKTFSFWSLNYCSKTRQDKLRIVLQSRRCAVHSRVFSFPTITAKWQWCVFVCVDGWIQMVGCMYI